MTGHVKGMRASIDAHRFCSADAESIAQLAGGGVVAADVEAAIQDGCPVPQQGRVHLLELLSWLLIQRRPKSAPAPAAEAPKAKPKK